MAAADLAAETCARDKRCYASVVVNRIDTLRSNARSGAGLRVEAIYLAQRLETRQLEANRLASTPLVVEAGRAGLCVLFRFGVVVFIHVTDEEQLVFRAAIEPLLRERFLAPASDRLDLAVEDLEADRVRDGTVVCPGLDLPRIQVIADALAKSVALIHYETTAATAFDEVEPLALTLERHGHTPRSARSLVKRIGHTLRTQTQMVGRIEAAEKPEVLWEHPELDSLHARLSDELELGERHRALERKLEVISSADRALLDLRLHSQNLRVEWYIVLLIVIEILISIYELSR